MPCLVFAQHVQFGDRLIYFPTGRQRPCAEQAGTIAGKFGSLGPVYQPGVNYSDFGCSVESYTNQSMLEVETLGPLTNLQPGAFVEHVEHWFLFKDVPVGDDEADIENAIRPKLEETEQLMKC